jgi:hypothetical protein
MKYIKYNKLNGEIKSIVGTSLNEEINFPENEKFNYLKIEENINYEINYEIHYILNNEIKIREPKPTRFHYWENEQWVLDSNKQNIILLDEVRYKRNELLSESDWTDTLSAKTRLGDEKYQEWQDYRQALRDITNQPNFPLDVVFPEKPSV